MSILFHCSSLPWYLTDVSIGTSEKAASCIEITDSPILTCIKLEQPQKANEPITPMPSGSVTDFNEVQPAKAAIPILVRDIGIVIYSREVHPLKAPGQILVTFSSIITDSIFSRNSCHGMVSKLSRLPESNPKSGIGVPIIISPEPKIVSVPSSNFHSSLPVTPPLEGSSELPPIVSGFPSYDSYCALFKGSLLYPIVI